MTTCRYKIGSYFLAEVPCKWNSISSLSWEIETNHAYAFILSNPCNIQHENYDIAIAMSSSRADPVLDYCPALAGGI